MDHNPPLRLGPLARRGDTSGLCDEVVHQLALVRVHGLESHRLAGLADLRDGLTATVPQLLDMTRAVALDVNPNAGAPFGLTLHRAPDQLLQGVERRPTPAD